MCLVKSVFDFSETEGDRQRDNGLGCGILKRTTSGYACTKNFLVCNATAPASITIEIFFSNGISVFIIAIPLFMFSFVGETFSLCKVSHGIVFQMIMFSLFIFACFRKLLRFCCEGPGLSCVSTPRLLAVLGMRTISWTALSFQPALLAVHFGTDGTQR